VLYTLMDTDRLNRLSEYEALAKSRGEVYQLGEMLGDLRRALWSELGGSSVAIDPFRRKLQRNWLSQIDANINPIPAMVLTPPVTRTSRGRSNVSTDLRALMRGELADLDSRLAGAIPRAADRTTRLHMIDMRAEIRRVLEPAD
jgi:hypothetical protein